MYSLGDVYRGIEFAGEKNPSWGTDPDTRIVTPWGTLAWTWNSTFTRFLANGDISKEIAKITVIVVSPFLDFHIFFCCGCTESLSGSRHPISSQRFEKLKGYVCTRAAQNSCSDSFPPFLDIGSLAQKSVASWKRNLSNQWIPLLFVGCIDFYRSYLWRIKIASWIATHTFCLHSRLLDTFSLSRGLFLVCDMLRAGSCWLYPVLFHSFAN